MEHKLKDAQWTKGLQKVVIWFLDADANPDYHQNLIIAFWRICNVPWKLHANYSVVFALSRQINKQKVCENN